MVSKNTNKLIVILMIIMCTSFVFAVDTTEYDTCVTKFGGLEDECADYCMGNQQEIVCSYPTETQRTYIQRTYPVQCENAVWNWNRTEEVAFTLTATVDGKSRQSSGTCNGAFTDDYIENYQVPINHLNAAKLQKDIYIDSFGVMYLEKPSKSILRDMYPGLKSQEISTLYDELDTRKAQNNLFTILQMNWDCDYQGTSDKQITNVIDLSKSTRFINNAQVTTWGEVLADVRENQCQWWDIPGILFGTYCEFTPLTLNVWDLVFNDDALVFNDNYKEYQYLFYYSDFDSAAQTVTCKYPKNQYANEEITFKSTVILGKTWEGLLFASSGEDASFKDIGLDNCASNPTNPGTCEINTYVTMYLNSTTGYATFIEKNSTDINQSFSDLIDKNTEIIKPIVLDPKKIGEENTRVPQEPDKIFTDENRDKVVAATIELSEYGLSLGIFGAYVIQIFVFVGAVILLFNSFKGARDAIKGLLFGKNPGDRQ